MTTATPLDLLVFAVLPYLAILSFLGIGYLRHHAQPFTYSSLSSQFLENQHHFWGLMPFHYGVIIVLLGHLVAFLIPREIIAWNSRPLRLWVLEITALVFGLLALIGLLTGMIRRLSNARLRRVTSVPDWILFCLLLVQLGTGVGIAVFYPWGSSWYSVAAVPYLRSLVFLNPQIATISVMPWTVKAHIISAFLLTGFFPFTRLVHVFSIPNPYLWRRPQVVRWYGRNAAHAGKGAGE